MNIQCNGWWAVLVMLMLAGAPRVGTAQSGLLPGQGEGAKSPDAGGAVAPSAESSEKGQGAESSNAGGAAVPSAESSEKGGKPWMRGVPLSQREAARAIFLQANVLIKDTLFARAAAKYKEAIALWEHPAFYFNLAVAELNIDQPIAAYRSLERALRYGIEPLGANRYEQARSYLGILDKQLARLQVVCDEAGAEVTLDGKVLFTGPGRYEDFVRPGGHQLVGSKPGRIPVTEQLVLSPGQRAEVTLQLRFPDRIETARQMPVWVPWASMGAGAVLVGVGGVFDSRSSEERAVLDGLTEQCPRGCEVSSVPELEVRFQGAERSRRVALGLYIGGGLVVAGSAILLYVNRERVVRAAGQASGPGDSVRLGPAAVVPIVSEHAAGVAIWSTF